MISKLGMKPLCAAGVVCAFAGIAAATPTISVFNLGNHPDGNAAPPAYGLRLDGMMGSGTTVVFSFVDVQLTVTDSTMDGGDITMRIHGLVEGGEVSAGTFADPEMYNLDFSYLANVEEFSGGWRVVGVNNVLNVGSLAPLVGDPEDVFTVTDNDDNAFIFAPDGHRLAGDNSSWVGRGWLTTELGGGNSPGTQDWLFVGSPVPAPGSAALLALGGLAAIKRRR